jgi:cytochrome P450
MASIAEVTLAEPTAEPVILNVDVPAHVPKHLVRDLRVAMGMVPNTMQEPYDHTLRLLQDDVPPVMFSPFPHTHITSGLWVVTRFADISKVYQDPELSSTEGQAAFQILAGETWPVIPLGIDAPDHSKYRRFLNPWFTPKAVAAMEADIRQMANEMIDRHLADRKADFAWDFARVFPVRVFLNLMGLPFSMFEQFLEWEHEILHSRDFGKMGKACSEIIAYLRAFIDEKEASPDDGLTSRIVNGEIEGKPLTEDEKIGTVFFLWLGGLDTVASTLAQMFRRLALDHDLQQRLREQPKLHASAIEEFLRMQPLVNSTRRLKKDWEIHGVQMLKGDYVMCLTTVGNFDPAAFANPRQFDAQRPANRHFTLASGPHICLGAHLARQELRIALELWLSRVPMFSLADGDSRSVVPGLMSTRNLPLSW